MRTIELTILSGLNKEWLINQKYGTPYFFLTLLSMKHLHFWLHFDFVPSFIVTNLVSDTQNPISTAETSIQQSITSTAPLTAQTG